MQLKHGHIRKKIFRDWRLLRCGCGESWKRSAGDMKTNEEVLEVVQEERNLTEVIWRRKKNWIGHILGCESLLREVIEGRMIGNIPRGRKRLGMLNEFLKESSYAEIKRKAEKGKSEEYGSQEPASRQNTNDEPAQDLYIHLDSETRV